MPMLPTLRGAARVPLAEAARLESGLRRLFAEPFPLSLFAEPVAWMPAVDVAERDGDLVVTAELPGMGKEDIGLELSEGVLTIKGEKTEESEHEEQEMHVTERSYGSFRRSLTLPCPVDETKVAAEFKDGVLRVTLPKTGEAKGRKIEITG